MNSIVAFRYKSKRGRRWNIRLPCTDQRRESVRGLCKAWKAYGSCDYHRQHMSQYCRKTCGYCTAARPSGCLATKYGCCKQSSLRALGKNNEGCHSSSTCHDRDVCKYFAGFCGAAANAETMRRYCPFTCRYCVPGKLEK